MSPTGPSFEKIACVAVIETSGTQSYIFTSNRQAENIGASHLITKVTEEAFGVKAPHIGVVPIVTSSGLLVFGAATREPLVKMIQHITDTAWDHAPGLDITGGIAGSGTPLRTANDAEKLLKQAFKAVRVEQRLKPPLSLRFPVNPLAEVCETGVGPAVEFVTSERRMLGPAAVARRDARNPGWRQIAQMMAGITLARNVDAFDKGLTDGDRWVGIVHADGNRVGSRIQNFISEAGLKGSCAAAFWKAYHDFSDALRSATEKSLRTAVKEIITDDETPFFPILVGGDDVTVILPGHLSIQFTEKLISAFGKECGSDKFTKGLTMSAGIAIVKPHYPFHAAYELAEQLTSSAKTLDGPAIDFHMLFDAAPSTLSELRKLLQVGSRSLTAKPLTVSDLTENDLAATRRLAEQLHGMSMSTVNDLRRILSLPGNPAPLFDATGKRTGNIQVPSYCDTTADTDNRRTRFLDALEIARLKACARLEA